jgi:hypothetical protein
VISVVVAMFTSPINLLIDFLFLEILSAPTVDSLKLDELETFNRLADVISSFGTSAVSGARTMGRRMGRRLSQVAQAAGIMNLSSVPKADQGVQRTLSIPPATLEAQIIASRTSSQLISQLREENETFVTKRDIERSASAVFHKRVTLLQKRTESVKGMPKKPVPVAKKTIDDLFTHLSVDIIEQRKVLPMSEQEWFDEQWGYGGSLT